MKNILIFLIVLFSSNFYAQSDFEKEIIDFEKISIPVNNEYLNTINKTIINRNFCWKYWILPLTKLKSRFENEDDYFLIDTTAISDYKQWENKNLNKKELIELYCPIFSGNIYCRGKIHLSNDTIGIFWEFYQNDMLYGSGRHTWLAIYTKNGEFIDFKKVFQDTHGGTPLELYERKKIFKLTKNSLVIDSVISIEYLDSKEVEKQSFIYTLKSNGFIKH